jgi:hypothetical protein
LAPHRLVLVGPAIAIGREPSAPALVDADEWELDLDGDRVVVTNLRPRATTFNRTRTAVRGRIESGGVVPAGQGVP